MVENNWISRAEENFRLSITEEPRIANKCLLQRLWCSFGEKDSLLDESARLWPFTFLNYHLPKF